MASAPRELRPPRVLRAAVGRVARPGHAAAPAVHAWHLSYVAIGAAVAPHIYADRLAAALAAFFLAVGISAHALDELHGRPLADEAEPLDADRARGRRRSSARSRSASPGSSSSPRCSSRSCSPAACSCPAYNLELAGGRFHSDTWFALAWGGFPAFTGYFVNSLTIRPAGVLVAAACCLLSAAQRQLSTPVRRLRRNTTEVTGQQHLRDGRVIELTERGLSAPLEGALKALWIALVLLAAALVAVHA